MIVKINGNVQNTLANDSIQSREVGFFDGVSNSWDFIQEWRHEGFWQATYGKSFFEVMKDFFGNLFHDIGVFILGNGDLFFLMPAVAFLLGTWLVGRNKFTKWITPLFLGYFMTRVFYYISL